MISFQDLQNATVQDIKTNPALQEAFQKLYFGVAGGNMKSLIGQWESGNRNFNADLDFITSSAVNQGAMNLAKRSLEKFANWNNPQNPEDQKAAQKVKKEGEQYLKEAQNTFKNAGIDISTVPDYKQLQSNFGITGPALTSQQVANTDLIGQLYGQPDAAPSAASSISNPSSSSSSGGLLGAVQESAGQVVAGMGQPGQSVTKDSIMQGQAGNVKFFTGNAELDQFLNDIYLPLIQAEVDKLQDPTAIFDDAIFKKVKENVDKVWGPIFKNELDFAQQTFDTQKQALDLQKGQQEKEAGFQFGDIATQEKRTQEELGLGKERIARSYTEALADSQAALANRNLSFGGTRLKEEAKLAQAKSDKLGDLQKMADQNMEDLATSKNKLQSQQQYQGDVYGLNLQGLNTDLTQQKQSIAGEELIQTAAEKEKLQNLAASFLNDPELSKYVI